jgi:hypothetical protein
VSPDTLAEVRRGVREVLGQSAAFQALPPEKQREIAQQTVQIASYLAEPDGIRADRLPTARAAGTDPYARAQDGGDGSVNATDDVIQSRRPASGSAETGDPNDPTRFRAQAAQEGARAAGALLDQVDFPVFVSGLIKGVFHSIVHSSIEQMEAYGKLVADVAKTINQFRDDNVSVNQGRDHLVEQFPDTFMIDMEAGGEEGPRVRLRDGVDDRQALRRVNESLPLDTPLTSLDDDSVEEKLVPAARTQLATSRQQLLATMVLMGINRIVVTDGRIQAKVMFDFQARDNFKAQRSATSFDYLKGVQRTTQEGEQEVKVQGGERQSSSDDDGWQDKERDASWYAKGKYKNTSEPVLKLMSVSASQTDAAITTKAQLMGNVEVNFKSDYLPLEKMADSFQIGRIQDAAKPGSTAPRGAGAAPAPAQPAPALPAPTP